MRLPGTFVGFVSAMLAPSPALTLAQQTVPFQGTWTGVTTAAGGNQGSR